MIIAWPYWLHQSPSRYLGLSNDIILRSAAECMNARLAWLETGDITMWNGGMDIDTQ